MKKYNTMILNGEETVIQDTCATCNTFLIDNNFDWKRLIDYKGVCNIKKVNGAFFVGKLKKTINKSRVLLKNRSSYIPNPQPICIIDCRKLKEGDALIFLEKLTELPKKPTPIVVVQNITEISADVMNKYEIHKLLIHLWEKKSCRIKNKYGQKFTIRPKDYTVYRTWEREEWDSLSKIWGTL